MYFWKTEVLADDIKNNNVSDKDWMKYFLAWTLFSTLVPYLVSVSPYEDMSVMLAEMLVIVGVVIFGVSITFKTNLQGSGTAQNYFSRTVALSLPIVIKLFSFSLLFGFVLGIVGESFSLSSAASEWVLSAFAVSIEIIYFWRINVHLNHINT